MCMNYLLESNARLKLAKNQAKAKRHPEAELLIFEIYSLFSSNLLSKEIFKKMHKKQACLFKRSYMINNKENQAEKEKYIT